MTRNGQFHPIYNFSHFLPPKHLICGEISNIFVFFKGGYISKFLSFSTFLNCFTSKGLKMTHNGEFPQKSGLDWLKMAMLVICMFFHLFFKMRLRLTQNGQFHPIYNFSHFLPPKHLISGEISKIFIPRLGVHQQIFEFFNFFKSFHTKAAQNDPQWQILPEKWLR